MSPVQASACETRAFPPTETPIELFAFQGLLLGFTASTGGLPGSEVQGLVVEPSEILGAASVGAPSVVEVFPFGVAPDCQPISRSSEDLRREYPLGAEVSVVGKLFSLAEEGPLRVTTSADSFGHVARVPTELPRTDNGLFDSEGFSCSYAVHPDSGFSMSTAWSIAHFNWFEDFEYLRGLMALSAEDDKSQRVEIARSLSYYWRFRRMRIELGERFYRTVLKQAKISRRDRKALLSDFENSRKTP